MGSGGCVRSKDGVSRRSAAAGEGVEVSGTATTEIFCEFWTMGR
jgi:hypothetical protein